MIPSLSSIVMEYLELKTHELKSYVLSNKHTAKDRIYGGKKLPLYPEEMSGLSIILDHISMVDGKEDCLTTSEYFPHTVYKVNESGIRFIVPTEHHPDYQIVAHGKTLKVLETSLSQSSSLIYSAIISTSTGHYILIQFNSLLLIQGLLKALVYLGYYTPKCNLYSNKPILLPLSPELIDAMYDEAYTTQYVLAIEED